MWHVNLNRMSDIYCVKSFNEFRCRPAKEVFKIPSFVLKYDEKMQFFPVLRNELPLLFQAAKIVSKLNTK